MNTGTLGGKTILDPPPNTPPAWNCFTMGTGAARFGYGQFLLTRADYEAIRGNATVQLVLTTDPLQFNSGSASVAKLEIPVVIAGAAPFSRGLVAGGPSDQSLPSAAEDWIVSVIVYDLRCQFTSPITAAYNVQKTGFVYNEAGTVPEFYASTLSGGTTQWTWTTLVTDMEFPAGCFDLVTLPTSYNPRNIIFDGTREAHAWDEIAGELMLILGFAHSSNMTEASDKIVAYNPNAISATNAALLSAAADSWIGGNDTLRNNQKTPSAYKVHFPKLVIDDADADPFLDRFYTSTVTTASIAGGSGGSGGIDPLHNARYVAAVKASAVLNSAELNTIATDLATRAFRAAYGEIADREYAGIWPFQPDGYIRAVRWTSTPHGAKTLIRINNQRDFSPLADLENRFEYSNNQFLHAYGSGRVGTTPSGVRFVTATGSGGSGGSGGGSITPGEYVGMVYTTEASNVAAWSFIQLHSVP